MRPHRHNIGMALPHVPRRSLIVGLVVVAAIAFGFVAAALANPWHLTGLYPLARPGSAVGVLVLAGALLATASLLRLAYASSSHRAGRRAMVALIVSLVAVPAFCVGLPVIAFGDSFRRESGGQVLAISPEGDFSAVKSTLDSD